MKTIKILGTGCPKCKQTEAIIKEVIAREGIEATVIKVEDIQDIMAYNILSTPAVVVDEVVKIKGKVPTSQEIIAALA
ncbi:thioredoxin family protein [Aquiflexum sp. TKW24L]|uniref:thioredoxin family protein n=1 Tax=Aquiflexum sp. TKW24L TaxID=2942212 RepID=UPI0020C01D88|nr:thioredoxin family protein [Aquiflexum sp. TKW24L]MCL6259152.1 thioredoxin family protein [Aquiflexum sp. TKW24L]